MTAHEDLEVREAVATTVETIGTQVVLGIGYDPNAMIDGTPEVVAAQTWTGTRLN
jgi:hypothetical protein